METTELLKKVRKIEIRTRGISRQIFSGEYHSAFKGKGIAFSEVREYQFGDDIRTIDWNVTARLNHPYVKIFEEERELNVMLLIDMSKSQYFGTQTQFKKDLVTELSAVLSFSAIQNNDKIGVIFFTDKVEKYIPPKKGKSHILRIIRELLDFEPQNSSTNIAEALTFFNNIIKKRSIVFIISDFIAPDFSESLKFASNRHDTIAIKVYDYRETKMPNIGLIQSIDPETGKQIWIDSSNSSVREQYQKFWLEQDEKLNQLLIKLNVDLIKLRTDESYIQPLMTFFKKRRNKIAV